MLERELIQIRPILEAVRKAVPQYARGLYDDESRVRLEATKAFENLGNARLKLVRRAQVLPTINDLKGNVEKSPQMLLKGSDFLEPFLTKNLDQMQVLVRDPDVRIRRAAVEVLEELEEKALPVLGALIAATKDPDRFVRWTAAKAIGTLPPEQAGPAILALATMLADPDINIRIAAGTSLEAMGPYGKPAVPAMAQAIRTGDVEARLAVLYALLKVGPEAAQQAVPSLILVLGTADPRVVKSACEVIAEIGPPAAEAIPTLRRLLGHDDAEVRAAASEAILSILRFDEK
jgi:HEAT repeat protein